METRGPAVIDAIVAALQAAGLTTWDGPILTGDYSDAVYVGYDADPEGDQQASSTAQEWAGIGLRRRNEEIDVTCAAVALTGESDETWKRARDAAYTLMETVGATLRATPSLGLGSPCVAELQPGDYFQENGPEGYQARVVFTVHITTRV